MASPTSITFELEEITQHRDRSVTVTLRSISSTRGGKQKRLTFDDSELSCYSIGQRFLLAPMQAARDFTPEQAAQITHRIGVAFDFIRAAIDDPSILDETSVGEVMAFRGVHLERTA